MRSWVSGKPDIDLSEHIDRKQWRFMGDAAGYAFLSMEQAIADSGLTPEQVSNVRTVRASSNISMEPVPQHLLL